MQHIDDRQHQEGAEHVGILEGARRAAIEGEDRPQPRHVEIAQQTGEARAPGGEEIAPAQRFEASQRVVGHDRGEEHRGHHQIDRDGGEAHRRRFIHPGDQREGAADVVEQQQQGQRQELLREADAGDHEDEDGQQEHDLVGRGLDQRQPARGGQQPERAALERGIGDAQAAAARRLRTAPVGQRAQ
ncbi:MAG: hypothetical protein C0420_12280 [Methylobacterium sp.]|nr:hypothetical protein [Methylobacterium sp.]